MRLAHAPRSCPAVGEASPRKKFFDEISSGIELHIVPQITLADFTGTFARRHGAPRVTATSSGDSGAAFEMICQAFSSKAPE